LSGIKKKKKTAKSPKKKKKKGKKKKKKNCDVDGLGTKQSIKNGSAPKN